MKTLVVVTKELADRGNYHNGFDCPLFHALQDAGLAVHAVYGLGEYQIGQKRFCFPPASSYRGQAWAWDYSVWRRIQITGEPFVFFHDDELGPIMPSDRERGSA